MKNVFTYTTIHVECNCILSTQFINSHIGLSISKILTLSHPRESPNMRINSPLPQGENSSNLPTNVLQHL